MELLDRYLNAIKFWLPRRQQDDIVAELSEDIRSEIEEQEAKLGRKLDDAEIATILKQHGRPLLVANRYLPQQHLIGPGLFPVYRFVLAVVVLCSLVPGLLVRISLMIFDPSYRSTHAVWVDLARGGQSFWGATLFAIGAVTAVFAVLERVEARTRFLENWDPRKLPPVRDPNRIPRFNSIVELGANLIFLVWWVSGTWSQTIFNRAGVRIVLTPVWRGFFWAFLVLALGNIALAAANLLYRQWTWPRALLRLTLDGAGAAAFCWLLKASLLAEISAPQLSPAQAAEVTNAINAYMGRLFPFALMACLIIVVLSDVPRLLRLGAGRGRLIQGVAMIIVLAQIGIGGSQASLAGAAMVDKNSATALGLEVPGRRT